MGSRIQFRWPDHWYYDERRIHCIISNCGFITPSETMRIQWFELDGHCVQTRGTEHEILQKMLRQSLCAIDDCYHPPAPQAQYLKLRWIFTHERSVHGSAEMSYICSFVRLAREGRICHGAHREPDTSCEKLAFCRLMEKIQGLPDATLKMLFQRSGLHRPEEQTFENMRKILTFDHLAQPGETPPYWWPIRAEHFLWFIRPNTVDPADDEWNVIWTRLREEYADGRI